jgi:hypothetical protein
MLPKQPARIWSFHAVCNLVTASQLKRNRLEDVVEELVKIACADALQFLSALDDNVMVRSRIDFDMRARGILRDAVGWQNVTGRTDSGGTALNFVPDLY